MRVLRSGARGCRSKMGGVSVTKGRKRAYSKHNSVNEAKGINSS